MKRIAVDPNVMSERLDDLGTFEKSMTQQNFADEVDVNNIVARAIKTGVLGDPIAIASRQAVFGDFSQVGSFHEALNKVSAAQKAFDDLPADVRTRFENDPAKLMEFLGDEKNTDEAVKLGLAVAPKVEPKPIEPVKPVEPVK